MGSADPGGVATFHNKDLPRGRRRSASLLAALEEDRTGRQPVSPPWEQDPGARGEVESLDSLVHVFLDDLDDPGISIGYARVDLASRTAELAMRPDSFYLVSELAAGVRGRFGVERFWAKGRNSAAAGLQARAARTLTIMTRDVPIRMPAVQPISNVRIRPFNPSTDTDTWLQANARIFAELPDQANLTRDDLTLLMSATWFDPEGFLVAESALSPESGILGFHWTKVDFATRFHHRISGEVFVLGVLEETTGTGLAGALLESGLHRIASTGVSHVHLYVESDNKRAKHFYGSHGFTDADQDQLLDLGP